jgi:probable rRNA maturation factor
MIKANVIVDFAKWKKKIKNPKKYLKKKLTHLKKISSFKNKNHEFSILLTNNQKMKKLNNKFRKKNKTTDVLSFPSYDQNTIRTELKSQKNLYLGDIALNLYKIDRGKNKFKSEFDKLWVHGLVHLMGYKHYKNKDFFKMKKIEDKIIKQLKC